MNNEECTNETSLACEEEMLDVLYKEAAMNVFNQVCKDNGITNIHVTGLDMMNPEDILKVAACIGAHSEGK